ncbi:uncharacterized protein LOC141621974 [Silene latifolia]|uniref:uncharacterized protein LOC141621974 n=1 Tax=Silene latifolia TaxID=37657 RepID=UPI003D76F497
MQGMWVSMKENMDCRNSVNGGVCHPKQHNIMHQASMGSITSSKRMLIPPSIFTEVGEADLSRKVVEKILGNALTNPTAKIMKIRKVFRVKNSPQVVDTFEAYRGAIKTKAKERDQKHTRSMVDGNELLGFYVTTVTCFSRESRPISAPCEFSDCNLCQLFGFSFDINNTEKPGMQLNINSEALRESIKGQSRGKKSKRAVIICRIIAGRIRSVNDRRSDDEYDSIVKKGFYLNSQNLIVSNPNAVLPCFVVILN